MFAYLVIAFELTILSTVFWYIFIREDKPFRVAENMWGQYDNQSQVLSNQIQPAPSTQKPDDWVSLNQSLNDDYCGNRSHVQFRRSVSSAKEGLPKIKRNPALKYGWVMEEIDEPEHATGRIWGDFRRTLEDLRLRMSS